MEYEGTLAIHQSLGGNGARFGVVFAPYVPKEEGTTSVVRRFNELQQVGAFLKTLGICKDMISDALRQLFAGRSVEIPSVVLSEKVVQKHGLDSLPPVKRRNN